MARQRLTIQKHISFTEKMAEDIQALADKLDVHFADIVRDCVQNDLPKMKERIRKRKTRGQDEK